MAWNPNSSPWGWDSGGFFTTTHGHGESNELQESVVNKHTTTSTSCLDGYGFSSRRNKNSGHSDPNLGMITSLTDKDERDSDMNGIVSSNGHGIERIPMLTTCIGGNGYFVDSSSDGHGGSAIQGRFHDNWDGISHSPSFDKTLTNNVNQRNSLKGVASKMMHVIADAEQGHFYSDVKNHVERCLDKTIANYVVNQRNGLSDNDDDSKMMLDAKQYIPLHSGVNSSNILKIGSNEDQYSSTATGSGGSVDSLTGLHLGKKSYSQDVCPDLSVKPKPKVHRKSRIGLARLQVPCCQVEGCNLDLTSAKDYHRRHKVCEVHSKSVKVVVSSLEQRFCQQCSRFHVLAEFDEAKRSCRRRLAGHNKRRRKPQPDPLELQARVHSRFEECDFLQHPRFPRMTLWQDPWDYRTGMMLPQYENHSIHNNYAWQVPIMERQVYIDGISPSIPHDKLPLLLFQNSKPMIEADASYAKDHHLQQQQQQNHLLGPVNNGLTLASSSSSLSQLGPGLFSGTEIIPVTTCLQPRVTDSGGRALSLLSLQTNNSHNLIDHNLLLHNNHQVLHHDEGMAPHQHCNDLSVESMMMSSLASSSHVPPSGATGLEKGLYGCSYVHDLNRCDFESENQSMMGTQMQGHDNSKKTQDLMRMSSFALDTTTATAAAGTFQLESSSLGDLQCSYGISYL